MTLTPRLHRLRGMFIAVITLLSALYAVLALVYHSYVPSDFLFYASDRTWSIDSAFVRPEIRNLTSGERIAFGISAQADMRLFIFLFGTNKVMSTLASLDSIQLIDPDTDHPLPGTNWILYMNNLTRVFDRHGILAMAKQSFGVLVEKDRWLPALEEAERLESSMKARSWRLRVYSSRGVTEVVPRYEPQIIRAR